MTSSKADIKLNKPQGLVLQWLVMPELLQRWVKFKSFDILNRENQDEPFVGMQTRIVFCGLIGITKYILEYHGEILELSDCRLVRRYWLVRTNQDPFADSKAQPISRYERHVVYELAECNAHTHLSCTITSHTSTPYPRFLTRTAETNEYRSLQKSLARLKRAVENQYMRDFYYRVREHGLFIPAPF